ncbi:histidine phosphatase superfamily [Endogone sp. FLAS-F59071]|nr:histidine phosphatase superfamily [Endogone sp. FLAS-F59071]|eukprot:RUS19848.1 histidine phosphatase superfamily [Endogone sp. FLAS-F59071]
MFWIIATLLLLTFHHPCRAVLDDTQSFDITKHLGTSSPYPIHDNTSSPVILPDRCWLTQIHYVVRHGTRYPSTKNTIHFDNLHALFKNAVLDSEHLWLRTWVNPYYSGKSFLLTLPGEKEMYLLGKRVAARYRRFLHRFAYDANIFEFRSSAASRSSQSGSAFAVGLFEGDGPLGDSRIQPIYLYTVPKGIDRQMAMKHACPRWLAEVSVNPFRDAEIQSFTSRHISAIARRLNTQFPNLNLLPQDVDTIYTLCGYEASFAGNTSTWCSLLQLKDFEAFEYLGDMNDYFTYSYGDPFNSFMACDLITDLVTDIEAMINGVPVAKRAIFKFGHAETINFFATLLGLYRDDQPLLANATSKFIRERKYRVSQMTPFAANIAFELLRCSGSSYKIRMLLNERPVSIPGCVSAGGGDGYACLWTTFKNLVSDKVGCNWQKICKHKTFGIGKKLQGWMSQKMWHNNLN